MTARSTPEHENRSHALFAEAPASLAPDPRSRMKATLPEIVTVCQALYERDGFVQWTEAGEALGITRQAVVRRLQRAVAAGDLDEATFECWQSISTRAAITRERTKRNQDAKRDKAKRTITLTFTEENYAWLRKHCVLRSLRASDVLNGCVTRMREEEGQ